MKEGEDWNHFEAEQYINPMMPGYVWITKLNIVPFIWMNTKQKYLKGSGSTLLKLMSAITISENNGEKIDQSSLAVFLFNLPWLPSMVLTKNYRTWQEINNYSAKAAIQHHGNKASVVFSIDEEGKITKVSTDDRFRQIENELVQQHWSAYYDNYQKMNGIMVPIDVRAEWKQGDESFHYLRMKITQLEYNIAEMY